MAWDVKSILFLMGTLLFFCAGIGIWVYGWVTRPALVGVDRQCGPGQVACGHWCYPAASCTTGIVGGCICKGNTSVPLSTQHGQDEDTCRSVGQVQRQGQDYYRCCSVGIPANTTLPSVPSAILISALPYVNCA